jgi:hypothetical protein
MIVVEGSTVFGFDEFAFFLFFRLDFDLKIFVFYEDVHDPVTDFLDFVVGSLKEGFPKAFHQAIVEFLFID